MLIHYHHGTTSSLLYCSIYLVFLLANVNHNSSEIQNQELNSKVPTTTMETTLIGKLHQLVGSLPHQSLRNLANKYGPLMYSRQDEVPNIVVSSPEIAKEIMTTYDTIVANRPYLINCSPDFVL